MYTVSAPEGETLFLTSTLRHVCCLENYESSDVNTFQKTLREILKRNVSFLFEEKEKKEDFMLLTVIPWRSLLQSHDENAIQNGDITITIPSSSSLLAVILELLCNPSIIPYASWGCLWIVLIQVFQKKPLKSKWRPSEMLLLRYMEDMARKVPTMSLLSQLDNHQQKKLRSMSQEIMATQTATKSYDINSVDWNRWKKYLRCLTELSQRLADPWFSSACINLLLKIIQTLDDTDRKLLGKPIPSVPTEDVTMCLYCQKQIRPLEIHSRPRRGFSMLQILDDFDDDVEKSNMKTLVSGRTQSIGLIQCRCPMSCRHPFSKDIKQNSRLPFHLFLLRSDVYDEVYQTAQFIFTPTYHRSSALKCHSNGLSHQKYGTIIIQTILEQVLSFPNSPSLRFSLLLILDCSGKDGYSFILNRLWYRFDTDVQNTNALRIWSELIAHSSFFDNPHQCWDALEPLFVRILYYCGLNQDECLEKAVKAYALLRSLAAALYQRRPTLYVDDSVIKEKFRDFITRVSVSFGEINYWISSDMDDDEVEEIVVTLQGLGVLGLPFATTLRNSHRDLSKWPFPSNAGVRDAYRRSYSKLIANKCFAKVEDVIELQLIHNRDEKQRLCKLMSPRCSLLTSLNDDAIKRMLKYLNHIDLIRFSSLSKLCNSLACDDFEWNAVYQRTYGKLGDEDDIKKVISKIGSWRNLFIEKYYCEKALRFKYSPGGWKYRTCGYVGCCKVMRSSQGQEKHYLVHEARYAKKRKREEIIQQKQLERLKKFKSNNSRRR